MDGELGCEPGGSLTLLDLIEQHVDAFTYDWRTRFGMPVSAVGDGMDWAEACALTRVLTADSSSRVATAVHGMQYPLSREGFMQADLIDLFAAANSNRRKPPPYQRPTDPPPIRVGKPTVSQRAIRAALAARGHH